MFIHFYVFFRRIMSKIRINENDIHFVSEVLITITITITTASVNEMKVMVEFLYVMSGNSSDCCLLNQFHWS